MSAFNHWTLQTPVLKFLILSSGRLSSNARMLSSVFPSILSHPFCLYLQTFQFLPRTLSFLRTTPHQTFTPKSPFSSTSFALRTTYSVLRLLLPTVPPLKASSLLDSRLLPQIVIVDTKRPKLKGKRSPFLAVTDTSVLRAWFTDLWCHYTISTEFFISLGFQPKYQGYYKIYDFSSCKYHLLNSFSEKKEGGKGSEGKKKRT